jgi:hypothetical protein
MIMMIDKLEREREREREREYELIDRQLREWERGRAFVDKRHRDLRLDMVKVRSDSFIRVRLRRVRAFIYLL